MRLNGQNRLSLHRHLVATVSAGVWVLLWCGNTLADMPEKPHTVPAEIQAILKTHCVECHGATGGKGNVRLVGWERGTLFERLDLLNKVQDQLFFGMMPPKSAEPLSATELATIRKWVRGELRQHHASKLDDKLAYPDAGNYIDHQTLFDGSVQAKAYTPARRWLVSPAIFEERVLDVFGLNGRERDAFKRSGFFGVSNPFMLPEHAGVRYYDLQALDGGHLLVMLGNAEWIANKQIHAARLKSGWKEEGADPKDKWFPKTTPAAFETIILKKTAPTDDEITSAIQTQFQAVLRRAATTAELDKYRTFTHAAIKLGGNTEGLRQLLKSVLLESEFLYRLEFGAGEADAHGRYALSPREAAFAIAYAISERNPDAALLHAAETGKLTTKADYEREVQRLLQDKTTFQGTIDKTLSLYNSSTATHPHFVRFFRDYFGYPLALKVFKDSNRSGGHFVNADRGNTQTPGRLIDEADRLVEWVLTQDQAVFETLLTTDRNFMYYNVNNAKGEQQIADWKKGYELLKDTDWKKNPDAVVVQHADIIKKYLDPKGLPGKGNRRHDNSLVRMMTHFEQTFGKGNNPFTILPWAHGNQFWYSPIYNQPKTPGRDGKYGGDDGLNYQPTQPFAMPNRKGLLTHPAWLIAFSSNFHSDPIRRGRWIREKLLAGVVPDVPITVDAKIPEDPHLTLRERVHQVTKAEACVKCHQRMNDLGYPLEAFDDFGRFRTRESLEHPDNILQEGKGNDQPTYKSKALDTTGFLDGTGNPKLDGPVADSFELIDRLAKSERARQSFIRHAFRFFMGRNEMLSDSQTLINADRAYIASGGSFKALVMSLITSDSFMYRQPLGNNK